jgi:hypothetical protein
MPLRVVALDHVQLAMPAGREVDAEAFYCDVLGFEVLQKPELLPLGAAAGSLPATCIWVLKTTSARLARRIRRSLSRTSMTLSRKLDDFGAC